ncbi:sce7726 family protein [Clostridium sp.]|uniref:sce7726 family protein n=1 Tax=Clostridium sp. TaxID=1506 RepID=UPI002844FC0E|nr:sce7726 family protein [Clostridium sp.]MDR3596872.1 sce7726 family protein [Clostridium sp.]
MNLKNENFIKSILIDYYLEYVPNCLIGNEVKYGTKGYFTDLIFLSNNLITAFEIKAGNDDFRTIRKQLDNYKKVFDSLYLVITEKHISEALAILREGEGLIIIRSDNSIELYKQPSIISKNYKKEILYSITVKYLKKYFNITKNVSSNELRNDLMKRKLFEIKDAYYDYLIERLYKKNNVFLSEKGKKTHYEDVSILSFNENLELY